MEDVVVVSISKAVKLTKKPIEAVYEKVISNFAKDGSAGDEPKSTMAVSSVVMESVGTHVPSVVGMSSTELMDCISRSISKQEGIQKQQQYLQQKTVNNFLCTYHYHEALRSLFDDGIRTKEIINNLVINMLAKYWEQAYVALPDSSKFGLNKENFVKKKLASFKNCSSRGKTVGLFLEKTKEIDWIWNYPGLPWRSIYILSEKTLDELVAKLLPQLKKSYGNLTPEAKHRMFNEPLPIQTLDENTEILQGTLSGMLTSRIENLPSSPMRVEPSQDNRSFSTPIMHGKVAEIDTCKFIFIFIFLMVLLY